MTAIYGVVVRDLSRTFRQKGRVLAGLVRPFMWLVLVGSGYNAIARVPSATSYHAFVYPGVIIMATFFGAMLTAIGTVYDREFGMLRLMLASPAGVPAILAGRAIAAAVVGAIQGAAVLVLAPFVIGSDLTAASVVAAAGAMALGAIASAVLGLVVAAPLRSVENFAGVINLVLFPLLFLSGALYPTVTLPAVLRVASRANPVTYAVDLARMALHQPHEFTAQRSIGVLVIATAVAFAAAVALFDPERRLLSGRSRTRG
jgi:ABC-2 type transport system permease protein